MCDVIIKNVPYRQDENMQNYIYDLCDAIEYQHIKAIKSAFRMSKNNNRSNPIILTFYDVADKREFMYAYFKHQKLNLSDLGFKTKLRIIICEALTNKNYEIFKKAMVLKRSNRFSSVSTKNGFVYYRLDQKSQPSKISSLSSLEAFTSDGAKTKENGSVDQQQPNNDAESSSTC